MKSRERRCVVLRGSDASTAEKALSLLANVADRDALWVGDAAPPRGVHARPSDVFRRLGQAFDAVVLDLHAGLDADVLGQCHGMVWGGGALVLRMPDAPPDRGRERLAVHPFLATDVGMRLWARFLRCLERATTDDGATPIEPASHDARGTDEQATVVAELARTFADPTPSFSVLIADRGRGKSSAMGLALAALDGSTRVAVSAGERGSCAEVLHHARGRASFVRLGDLLRGEPRHDVIVVDEAAQLPVPTLQRLVTLHPDARIAFASTVRGYEGTGRGFALRFLEWLGKQARPVVSHTLSEPIRWAADDELERFVFDALLLDAEPGTPPSGAAADAVHTILDRDALLEDDALLRSFFGLLVHAHYRTTPSDLHRILDAPNVRLHAMMHGGAVVAASLVAIEGELPASICEQVLRGALRIRGHALPDTIISHLGRADAGALTMIRSVRIAVHPAIRRRGLGRVLSDHVHRAYEPDLFGTLFGATPELLRFRRSVGYELVRVGASRGARTGEPAAVMLRPVSDRARALFGALRADLARDLPLQLELREADDGLELDPELETALVHGLPPPAPLSDLAVQDAVRGYAYGPRTYESAAVLIRRFVESNADPLAAIDTASREIIMARVRDRAAWTEVAASASLPSVPAAMRALRRAVRDLVEASRRGER